MINRTEIINFLTEATKDKEYVMAMWLNGADGQNSIDEYSDIDVVYNVKKEYLNSFFQEIIEDLDNKFSIDYRLDENYSNVKASCIHLNNTSEYLLIDLYIQHEDNYIMSNITDENPTIIFDKNESNKFYKYIPDIGKINRKYLFNKGKMIQESRINKYILRNRYLEAYAKYMEYIVKPLTNIIRLDYVPQWSYFDLCHIHKHLPQEIVDQLIELYKVNDLNDIKNNIKKAKILLQKIEKDLNERYGIEINNQKDFFYY